MTSADALLALAQSVGLEAAAFVAERRPVGRVPVAATKSSDTDAVTEIDRASEELIRRRILDARPDDGFLGEEGDDVVGTSGVRWVVDPIDGTVNFVYGLPAYAVSIAAEEDGEVVAGFVVNVATGERFGATLGGGSWVEQPDGARRALRAEGVAELGHALVATGFSYSAETREKQGAAVAALLPQVRDVRRVGSAALDLCGLADNRYDAYVEQGLNPWDRAAGGLVATEAGVRLGGADGEPSIRLVIAATPGIAEEFFRAVDACGF